MHWACGGVYRSRVADRKGLNCSPFQASLRAGGGIGSAIATALAPTHTLLLAGRPSDRLDAVARRLGATTFPLDLTDGGDIEAACEVVDELDVLVHNAGLSIPGNVADSNVGEWRATFAVNVFGPVELTLAFLAGAQPRKVIVVPGRLVNLVV
ncbi:SDR family NAD(P)-dependent oxidoreductase [Mycobacterium avium]|uniref:SDR family NAD(P)-dependent oxidoreductase n=1 Tax=Mycobacterium avium TaxID=1764 RepID=UPI00373FC7AB